MRMRRRLWSEGAFLSTIGLSDSGVDIERNRLTRFERNSGIPCFFPGEQSAS